LRSVSTYGDQWRVWSYSGSVWALFQLLTVTKEYLTLSNIWPPIASK
jgi:hypothetical protein